MKARQVDSESAHEMAERRKIYTSHFNQMALKDRKVGEVKIFDTTLRDGEQTPGIALSKEDKLRIAELLDELGVHVLEAGFPATSEGEREAVRSIVNRGLNARVCGLARANKNDIDAALSCDLDYIHVFIATSDIHLKYKLKMTREEVMERAVSTVEYAKDHGVTVEFSCEDATRTDLSFLKEMHIAVQEAGVDVINVPDTVGVIAPEAMNLLITELMKVTHVPLSVHCHDDLGLAVANSITAVLAGAKQIHVCVNGLGERAGNAALEEVAMDLLAFFGVEPLAMSKIGQVCKTVSRITGYPIPNNKAIVGNNAFSHESGIHVHGITGHASTYEAFGPELVGMSRAIVMGKHSGAHSVRDKLRELGVEVPDEYIPEIVQRIKELAESGKHVDDAELIALTDHIISRQDHEERVKLKEFAVFTGKGITPTATVTVEIDGDSNTVSQIGVGPVDAAIKALRTAVDENLLLEEYRLSAITGGSDSLAEVTVLLRDSNGTGRLYVGKGIGTDIVQTSVDATVEAINRRYSIIRKEV